MTARAHALRLGLRPARPAAAPADPRALERRVSRLEEIVGFLERRREVARAVDERPLPAARPRGRGAAAELRREFLRAARLAVALGMSRPAPPRVPAGRAARLREAARWHAIGDWLVSRTEKLRPAERPMRERVRYYDEFMCIASHESGRRWDVSTGNGYYGGLQMDIGLPADVRPRALPHQGHGRPVDGGGADPRRRPRRRRRAASRRGPTPRACAGCSDGQPARAAAPSSGSRPGAGA